MRLLIYRYCQEGLLACRKVEKLFLWTSLLSLHGIADHRNLWESSTEKWVVLVCLSGICDGKEVDGRWNGTLLGNNAGDV